MWTPSSGSGSGRLLVLVLLQGILCLAQENAIPSYIKVCKRNDPDLNNCILNSVENLRPKLKTGIPELEVPGIEPLELNELNINPGQGGRIPRFKAIGHNVKAYGVSDFEIHALEADPEKHLYRVSISIPVIRFEGDYEVNLHLMPLPPIKTRGPMYGNTTDAYGEAELQGRVEVRDGKSYLKFDTMNVDIALSNYHIYLGNLFGNDPILSQSVNQAINANSKEFVKVIKPIVDSTAADALLEVANKITDHFTIEQLFPTQ